QLCASDFPASVMNSEVSMLSWNMREMRLRNSAESGAPLISISPRRNEISRSNTSSSIASGRRRIFAWRSQRNGASRYQPCDSTVDSKEKCGGTASLNLEATAGIEPADEGFADLCLT